MGMSLIKHLIVGLGNPGAEYQSTRHNIGFMVLDALALQAGPILWKKKFKGLVVAPPALSDQILLKPMTFMNLSGEAVAEALRFYKLEAPNVIVFHDDIDLLPGQVKIKQGGGSGGHNGLKSIDAHIGSDYWRVRLGVGHPEGRGDEVTQYVLGTFSKADKIWLEPLFNALIEHFKLMTDGKPMDYLGQIARKMPPSMLAKH